MAEGKWTPGKIVLVVAAILVGLAILCCGGLWLAGGDTLKSVLTFTIDSGKFAQELKTELGDAATFGFPQNDKQEFILAIAVPDELTPERVAEVQDTAWKAVGHAYGEHAMLPVKWVAVGRRNPDVMEGQPNSVRDWAEHMVAVEDLVERTGVPMPRTFFPGKNIKITVGSGPGSGDAEEKPSDESGGK